MSPRSPAPPPLGRIRIGISGYVYPRWRGVFYPDGLAQRRELEYASRIFSSIELNGTFYSLRCPADYRRWRDETPDDFVFAVKGGRFITHNLKLARSETALANFFGSGILALGPKTGPFLWQLPATYAFRPERVSEFLRLLPRDDREAAQLAEGHDHRLRRGALVEPEHDGPPVRYRHAFEVRHPSWFDEGFYTLLREAGIGFVIADTAGRFPYAEEVTSDHVYVRLHGSQELYVSGYTDAELDAWARKIRRWARAGLDVYVYFDNDAKVHAPHDAQRLAARLSRRPPVRADEGRAPAGMGARRRSGTA